MEFRHAVIRAALLGQMSAARRKRLHRDIATVLERDLVPSGRPTPRGARPPPRPRPVGGRTALVPARGREAAADASTPAPSTSPNAACSCSRGRRCPTPAAALRPAHRPRRRPAPRRPRDARRCPAGRRRGDRARRRRAHRRARCCRSACDRSTATPPSTSPSSPTACAHLTDPAQVSRWHVAAELSLRKAMLPSANAVEHRARLLDVSPTSIPTTPLSCQIAMRCARSLTSIEPAPAMRSPITERFAPDCGGVDSDGLPVELGLSTMWLHLGDRAASDRYLDLAAADPLRRLLGCSTARSASGRPCATCWTGGGPTPRPRSTQVHARGAHDPNILLGCDAQANWLRRETRRRRGRDLRRHVHAMAEQQPGLALLQAVLASDAAEAGHLERRASPARPAAPPTATPAPAASGWPCRARAPGVGDGHDRGATHAAGAAAAARALRAASWPSPAPASS